MYLNLISGNALVSPLGIISMLPRVALCGAVAIFFLKTRQVLRHLLPVPCLYSRTSFMPMNMGWVFLAVLVSSQFKFCCVHFLFGCLGVFPGLVSATVEMS